VILYGEEGDAVMDWLKKYGSHPDTCSATLTEDATCNCGLDDILKAAEEGTPADPVCKDCYGSGMTHCRHDWCGGNCVPCVCPRGREIAAGREAARLAMRDPRQP
jgi:hypothetical protein